MAGATLHLAEEENITLSASQVRRLLACGSGDACLLYLSLKQNRDAMEQEKLRAALRWDALRFDAAKRALAEAGLILLPEEKRPAAEPAPEAPEYSDSDVARKLESDREFEGLLHEVERKLGPLSTPGVKKLLGLYEELGLPCGVVYQLVNHCIERKEEQLGAGRRPTMREIEKEGYAWARRELFTSAAVDAYLKTLQQQKKTYGDYMAVLQLGERAPSPGEEKYLAAWTEMGFPSETVAIAYDKTMLRCHEFKWPYCNGILKRWHEKGLHTPAQVSGENAKKEPDALGKNAWMKQYR